MKTLSTKELMQVSGGKMESIKDGFVVTGESIKLIPEIFFSTIAPKTGMNKEDVEGSNPQSESFCLYGRHLTRTVIQDGYRFTYNATGLCE